MTKRIFFYAQICCNEPAGKLSCYDIDMGAGGLEFESRGGQAVHSVANGSPPLRRFFGAALPRH